MEREDIKKNIEEYYNEHIAGKKSENVPISGKVFDSEELKNMVDAILDGWWTDAGTFESLLKANALMASREKRRTKI